MRNLMKTLGLILLLSGLAVFLAGCGGGSSESGSAGMSEQKTFTWKVQGFTPAGVMYDGWGRHWAENVTRMSNGRLTIEWYPVGAIVAGAEAPQAVIDGTLDAEFGYSALWKGFENAAPLFTAIPGLFSDGRDMIAWLYQGGGLDLWQEMLDKYNVKVLPIGLTDMEVFQWSNVPIRSIEDMQGLRMRFLPFMGEILADNGMDVYNIPGSEVVPSLERGVIDSAEYTMPAQDIDLGFPDATKYYHYPGIHQPSSIDELVINGDSWAELPDDLKAIVETACMESVWYSWLDQGIKNLKAMERLEEMGVELVILPDEVLQTMNQWIDEWFEVKMQEDPFLQRVRESQVEFARTWLSYKRAITIPDPEWSY